jgi:hypothetical protein
MASENEQLFSREQLAASEHFAGYGDIIGSVMGEYEKSSVKALDKRISKFLSRKIN